MSYYPPEGKEKKALLKLEPMVRTMDALAYDIYFGGTIAMGHAIKGVRCNGHQQVRSIADIFDEMDKWLRDIKHIKALVVKAERTLERTNKIRDGFINCDSCVGRKGKMVPGKTPRDPYSGQRRWEDCANCAGRGILPR